MSTKDYANVSDALNDLVADDSFRQEVKDQICRRRVVKTLSAMRVASGLTQANVADILGCKQSDVSRIEKGMDSELKMSEIEAYAKATGYEITIIVSGGLRQGVGSNYDCSFRPGKFEFPN